MRGKEGVGELSSDCKRCGLCCQQGGAALHVQDLSLVLEGKIAAENLVTIRRGELAFQPLKNQPQPVEQEFLKLQGKRAAWACCFYDEAGGGCSIYEDRPYACRLLECKSPEPLLAITGKGLLTRFDIIRAEDPILKVVQQHEKEVPCPDLEEIRSHLRQQEGVAQILEMLEQSANKDIQLRGRVAMDFGLSVGQELFYFGRPLFQLLAPLGIDAANKPTGGLTLNLEP